MNKEQEQERDAGYAALNEAGDKALSAAIEGWIFKGYDAPEVKRRASEYAANLATWLNEGMKGVDRVVTEYLARNPAAGVAPPLAPGGESDGEDGSRGRRDSTGHPKRAEE